MPMATKKKIANRSRNGSSRLRASDETGPSLIVRPAMNAARARGMPVRRAPAPATARPVAMDTARNRSGSLRMRARTRGRSREVSSARAPNAVSPSSVRWIGRPAPSTASRMIAPATPITSWRTDQPISR